VVLAGEVGGAGEPDLHEVLIEGVFVEAVAVRIQVDVGEGSTAGVFRIADARDLQPHKPLG
jgi:hypothetical protein